MKTLLRILQLPAVLCGLQFLTVSVSAQTAAFTYQGRLTDNSAAANGNYDMIFTIHSAATGTTGVVSQVSMSSVTVTNGLFTVTLNVGPSFPGADRWLQIEVRPAGSTDNYTPLTPRQKFTSAPYAIRAASAGTAAALSGNLSASQISGGTLAVSVIGDGTLPAAKLTANSVSGGQIGTGAVDSGEIAALAVTSDKLANNIGVWNKSGTTINYTTGAVGIGTVSPQGKLDINTGVGNFTIRNDAGLVPGINVSGGSYPGILRFRNKLEVWPNDAGTSSGYVEIRNAAGATTIGLDGQSGEASIKTLTANTGVGVVTIRNDAGLVPAINVSGGGYPGVMRFRNSLEVWPNDAGTAGGRIDVRAMNGAATIALDGETGDASVRTLTITGGSDLAEPFDLADTTLEAGTVVVIDDSAPGRLAESSKSYDKCVAGIISGAGGINPGISLQQEGVNSGGRKVALTGRVYVRAEAESGAIEPGDLLTTSTVSGYAMCARDGNRRQGAVLGKAMSRLVKGRGLVLVLVTLQ